MPNILEEIVATKRQEIADARERRPQAELERQLDQAPPTRDFFAKLAEPGVQLIAEVKKASPSRGLIRSDFDPPSIARAYADHGAACISVLTDEQYFQGNLQYLSDVREAVDVPLLRKDFILDPYQLFEARLAGADAVLLIAECLDDCHLRSLHNHALDLGLAPLVELYEPENLPRVLEAGAQLIGVNNRNLRTFETDLEHSFRLRQQIPEDCLMVAESGIRTHEDVSRLESAGIDAMLVGEHLMSQDDIGQAVRRLLRG